MDLHAVLDILAILVLAGCLWQAIGYMRWQHIDCPHCNMKMRFRCVSDAEEKRLASRMREHIASHAAEGESRQ